jgi:AbrB family looped-hinge helix DNA binding protein
MPTATVTSKGQTTIPKEIRDRFRLVPGTRIDFIVQPDGTLTVQPVTTDVRTLFGILKKQGDRPVTTQEMHEAVMDAAAERDRRSRR